jgi:hypothetical protein
VSDLKRSTRPGIMDQVIAGRNSPPAHVLLGRHVAEIFSNTSAINLIPYL